MRTGLAAAAALGLMAFTGTAPSAAPGESPKITNPDWARKPSAYDVARYYPEKAQRLELDGRATVVCRVRLDGRLRDCEVVEETPPGAGFGEATRRMAEKEFRMTPMMRDGAPVDGGTVRIPLVYRLPEGPPGPTIYLDMPRILLALGGLIGAGLLLIGAILMWDLRRRKTDL